MRIHYAYDQVILEQSIRLRFQHTIICLTNKETEAHNRSHLATLSGDLYSFPAIDTEHSSLPSRFKKSDVPKMGYYHVLDLKPGCRVIPTVNDESKRLVNGMIGTINSIAVIGGDPIVKVLFDNTVDQVRYAVPRSQ